MYLNNKMVMIKIYLGKCIYVIKLQRSDYYKNQYSGIFWEEDDV